MWISNDLVNPAVGILTQQTKLLYAMLEKMIDLELEEHSVDIVHGSII